MIDDVCSGFACSANTAACLQIDNQRSRISDQNHQS
jgi:hypothetical protein